MKPSFAFIFSIILLSTGKVMAAACCGGGFASPSLISGDDRAQLTGSYNFTEIAVDNVDAKGIWRKWDSHQKVQTLRLEGAHIFKDSWQAGFVLPIMQRTQLEQNSSGLGDVAGSVGYEYLPDWDYNPWRPKGIGFLQAVLPTGKARAESEVGGMDSRGNGFWAVGVGTLLTKSIQVFDLFSSIEIHRSFEKSIRTNQFDGTLVPGWGGNFSLGGGYNLKSWRLGGSLAWNYEDAVKWKENANNESSIERYATATASLSYMANDEWAGTFSYLDQTLIGSPVNTSLGRGVTLQMQRRWGR